MFNIGSAILLGILTVLFYIWNSRKFSYWKRRGVPHVGKSWPIIGDVIDVLLCKKSLGQFYEDLYKNSKDEKYVGYYELTNPCLLVNDPQLIENILVKDFSYFINRDVPNIDREKSEVDSGLPMLKDTEWRGVRYKLIPAFSTGKLKQMFQYVKNCAQCINENIESYRGKDIDITEITTMYSLDSIATCAFGIDIRNDAKQNSQFRTMGRKIFNLSTFGYYCFLLLNLNSKLAEKLGLTFTSGKVGHYFANIIKDTIKIRSETNVKRNDFIDILVQLKHKGVVEVQSKDPDDSYLKLDFEPSSETFKITDTILVSQAFVFLTAGFDGLSGPMACLLYELAKHQDIQEYLRADIEGQIKKYGDLTYDALKNAKYLDCCINECLRIYPLSKFILRLSNKDYEIEPGVKIEAGTKIIISNSGTQVDPNYYPNPLEFDPSRFEGEITSNVSDFTYLPFGAGPRMCIGMRLAQQIMKMGVATVLLNHRVYLGANTPSRLTMKIKTFFINQSADQINLSLKRIK